MNTLRNGNLNSFDLIFNKCGDRLFGYALKYLELKEEAEGFVQVNKRKWYYTINDFI